jgi:hypothetical protein
VSSSRRSARSARARCIKVIAGAPYSADLGWNEREQSERENVGGGDQPGRM